MIRPYYNLNDNRRGYGYQAAGPQFRIGAPLTPAVKGVMIACVAVFILQTALGGQLSPGFRRFVDIFGFTPSLAFQKGFLWQFVTYIFLHAGFWHIFFNLFFLWMVGGLVEMRLGSRRFLWLFFVTGALSALTQGGVFALQSALGWGNSMGMTTVGASGSIMGVAAACGVFYPEMRILLFFIIPMKMKHFVILLAAFEILAASNAGSNVAHFAHLGGLGAGYLFAKYDSRVAAKFWRVYYRVRGRFKGFVGASKTAAGGAEADVDQAELDRILDKIFRQSTASLTEAENEFLKKASKRFKGKHPGAPGPV